MPTTNLSTLAIATLCSAAALLIIHLAAAVAIWRKIPKSEEEDSELVGASSILMMLWLGLSGLALYADLALLMPLILAFNLLWALFELGFNKRRPVTSDFGEILFIAALVLGALQMIGAFVWGSTGLAVLYAMAAFSTLAVALLVVWLRVKVDNYAGKEPPEPSALQWLLASSAPYTVANDWVHDRLDADPDIHSESVDARNRQRQLKKTQHMLAEAWGITDVEDLRAQLQRLLPAADADPASSHKPSNEFAWDVIRASYLARSGFIAGWFSEQEALSYMQRSAIALQSYFDSWEQLGVAFLAGRAQWSAMVKDRQQQRMQKIIARLLKHTRSPWRQLAWDIDLSDLHAATQQAKAAAMPTRYPELGAITATDSGDNEQASTVVANEEFAAPKPWVRRLAIGVLAILLLPVGFLLVAPNASCGVMAQLVESAENIRFDHKGCVEGLRDISPLY